MSDKSKIEWTDASWNPVTGCAKVSAGCANCYAERMAKRLAGRAGYPSFDPATDGPVGNPFAVTLHPECLDDPRHWRKPRRVFVCSMGDLFHPAVPVHFIARVFQVMREAERHTFQILTKRPERMVELFASESFWSWLGCVPGPGTFLPKVWLGTSVEDQATADARIPHLLRCPAAVRFVSYEPALGPVDFGKWLTTDGDELCPACGEITCNHGALDWVIAGGESGPRARPAHPDWFRSVRDQCAAAGVPFFFKQWGEWAEVPFDHDNPPSAQKHDHLAEQYLNLAGGHGFHGDAVVRVRRVGKRAAGHLLDGVEHREFPGVARG